MDRVKRKKTKSPLKAIRYFCLECLGESPEEVKNCTCPDCPLYPFRFGKNPYRKKKTITKEHLRKLQKGKQQPSSIFSESSLYMRNNPHSE